MPRQQGVYLAQPVAVIGGGSSAQGRSERFSVSVRTVHKTRIAMVVVDVGDPRVGRDRRCPFTGFRLD